MSRTAIVILNYNAYHETEKCVESILEHKLDITGIVIVDNASSNQSFSYLKKKFQHIDRIKTVRSRHNVGFAKGNNIGIKIARCIWKAEFILLLNSDTLILEQNYLSRMEGAYNPGVGVIQSGALRINGQYTGKNSGTYDLKELIFDITREFFALYDIQLPGKLKWDPKMRLDPWISGCDIFLTPDYFKLFNGLYPLTFLYGEEYILATILRKAGLKWKLVETAYILHMESRSTPDDFKEGTLKKKKMMLTAGRNKIIVRLLPLKLLQLIINHGRWQK